MLPLDKKRDEEAIACGKGMQAFIKMHGEAMAKAKLESKEKELDEEENESMQRSRSCLVQLQDRLRSLRTSLEAWSRDFWWNDHFGLSA